MPSIFVSHGAPLVILQKDRGQAWREWASAMDQPAAVLVISAHWETEAPRLGTAETLDLIYDFFGFPEELYQVRYPAPGAPELRERVQALLAGVDAGAGAPAAELAGLPVEVEAGRGWDHGVWTPLYFMYPEADVPVLQLSLPRHLSGEGLLALGRALAPLRDEGVLILASGSLTHNLRAVNFRRRDGSAPDWVADFDRWCVERLEAGDYQALARAPELAPGYDRNHPSPEHYLPLLVAAGAAEPGEPVAFPLSGFEFEVLSLRCVQFGGR